MTTGELNSIESYIYFGTQVWTNRVNYGTWQSIIRFYSEFSKLRPLLKKLYPQELPKPKYKLKHRLVCSVYSQMYLLRTRYVLFTMYLHNVHRCITNICRCILKYTLKIQKFKLISSQGKLCPN